MARRKAASCAGVRRGWMWVTLYQTLTALPMSIGTSGAMPTRGSAWRTDQRDPIVLYDDMNRGQSGRRLIEEWRARLAHGETVSDVAAVRQLLPLLLSATTRPTSAQ